MIRGFYRVEGGFRRPFVIAKIIFPRFNIEETIEFLVDTGADVTMLGEKDILRIGLDYEELGRARKDLGGIGGKAETYVIEAIIKIEPDFVERMKVLTIRNELPEKTPKDKKKELRELYQRMPSLLGRDIIEEFGLFMHGRTDRLFLLQDSEIPEELFGY